MLPKTRFLYILTALSVLGAAIAAGASLFVYRGVAEDAAKINKAGYVRGYVQRAAKWGLEGVDSSRAGQLVADVEAVLSSAAEAVKDDPESSLTLNEIRKDWSELKKILLAGGGAERRVEILGLSEDLWALSMRLVEEVQVASEGRAKRGRYLAYGLLGILVVAAGIFFFVRSYVAGRLESASIRDQLTGLYNRRFFEQELAREERRLSDSAPPFSLIAFDLDRFKDVNDRHGHAEGDRVLKAVARVAGAALRRSDLLFRLGGDEFTVLLWGAGEAEAAEVAEKLRRAVEGLGAEGCGVSASLGVAQWQNGEPGESLLSRADRALYAAKAEGRNRVARASALP